MLSIFEDEFFLTIYYLGTFSLDQARSNADQLLGNNTDTEGDESEPDQKMKESSKTEISSNSEVNETGTENDETDNRN